MAKPKGGRGCTAPYKTHQVRIPDPIKPQVHELIERYQKYLAENGAPLTPPSFLDLPVEIDSSSEHDEVKKLRTEKKEMEQAFKAVNKFIEDSEKLKNQAISVLQESVKLKANAGGAIKKEVQKAIELLQSTITQ